MAKLEVNHLTISFRTNNGAVRAVRDVSFSLNEGETLAIAGESGSGKSVTTRAVMGILAGNAIVDNGEIIYDGRDLLKIPEEDFHTLRGHKLSMIFQDLLSALNPIMRIGKQLTEAMLLNNKERCRDGRVRFNEKLHQLRDCMIAAEPGKAAEKQAEIETFRRVAAKSTELQNSFRLAQESVVEAGDCIEEIELALLKKNEKDVKEASARLFKACTRVHDDFVIRRDNTRWQTAVSDVITAMKGFRIRNAEALTTAIAALKDQTAAAANIAEPDFMAIAYASTEAGMTYDTAKEDPADISARAGLIFEENFLSVFRRDCEAALRWSADRASEKQLQAADVLSGVLPVFRKENLNKKECEKAIVTAADAVEGAIDRLAVDKDNQSYIFRSTMQANCKRYFAGVRSNPKEQARFDRETKEYEKEKAAGKSPASVVPLNLIDLGIAQGNMVEAVSGLEGHFRQETVAAPDADKLINYLRARSDEYAYKLTQGMARHRAIELMKEVGIPEPHKRFTQYPFEFSGGMRQRIVIAIALSANPDILICDEPTTALDVTIQAQILELINRLKKERNLSVIFITHDLGVVANMADRIAIMYAGKIVEYGTADDVFYDPRHPYTWALLSSMPDLETREKLEAIPGTPPNMILPPQGDAFAARNKYAMQIDFEQQPPMFRVSETHQAATWLLHPDAPKVDPPAIVTERIARMKREQAEREGGAEA